MFSDCGHGEFNLGNEVLLRCHKRYDVGGLEFGLDLYLDNVNMFGAVSQIMLAKLCLGISGNLNYSHSAYKC